MTKAQWPTFYWGDACWKLRRLSVTIQEHSSNSRPKKHQKQKLNTQSLMGTRMLRLPALPQLTVLVSVETENSRDLKQCKGCIGEGVLLQVPVRQCYLIQEVQINLFKGLSITRTLQCGLEYLGTGFYFNHKNHNINYRNTAFLWQIDQNWALEHIWIVSAVQCRWQEAFRETALIAPQWLKLEQNVTEVS